MPEIIDVNTLFGPLPTASCDLSVDELCSMMDAHGVQSCCTLSTIGMLLDYSMGNGASRAACSENSRLLPVATLNPQSYFGGDGPWTRFGADGFKLVRFFPGPQGWNPEYAAFGAALDAMRDQKLPIMVDVPAAGVASGFARLLENYPAAVILAGVDVDTLAECVALLRTHAHFVIESSRLLASGAIKLVADSVGAARVLYGSGATARPMAASLRAVRYSGCSDADQAMILGQNARRVLGLN